MKTASLITELGTRFGMGRIAAAFGVFDGVHRGHRHILERVRDMASRLGACPVVVTFEPHPRAVLGRGTPPPLLTPLPLKLRLLEDLGMAAVVLLPFDGAMAAMPAREFLLEYVFASGGPAVLAICVGAGWRFGRRGDGTVETLRTVGQAFGCAVESLPELREAGHPVSSTRIRDCVQRGDMETAASLLGRPFAVLGTVQHGQGLGGAGLSCPTANLDGGSLLLPPDGVYAATGRVPGVAETLKGIAYVGRRPTVETPNGGLGERVVELHLFDVAPNLYGVEIEVGFLRFLRADQRFPSLAELREQIQADVRAARAVFAAASPTPAS